MLTEALPETMRAVMVYGPGDYRLETVPTPRARRGEIILKVEACGICAGDLKAHGGAASFWGFDGQPKYIKEPMIPGHEFFGVIVEAGEGVDPAFQPGKRVAPEQIVPCWDCRFCREGNYYMCQKHDLYGFQSHVNGGMAEYVRLTKESVNHLIPDDMPAEAAVLIEPFACAKHCVDRAGICPGDIVVQAGAGTLGLAMISCARRFHPGKIVALDRKDDRLALAKRFGADVCINPDKEDAAGVVKDMTDGYGCDVYIEATGHPSGVGQGLDMIRKMGNFVEFSVFSEPATVDFSIIGDRKEINIYGAHLSPDAYEPVVSWLCDGSLPYEGVVTHRFPLEQFEEAFAVSKAGDKALKVILIP